MPSKRMVPLFRARCPRARGIMVRAPDAPTGCEVMRPSRLHGGTGLGLGSASSFVPPAPIQELRDLTRTRKQLVREAAQHSLRIQKVLEDANLKLASVLSDVLTASGRAMLKAIIAGESDPERLADLARGTARRNRPELVEALRGRLTAHHRMMLKLHLDLIADLDRALAEVD